MSCSIEEREHVETILRRSLGAGWAQTAEILRIVRVRRVTLEEQAGQMRRALIWDGPESITSRLEGVELLPSEVSMSRRALCLDVMTETLQRRVSASMEAWAKASRSYPVVSVQLATEQVAEVRFAGSRRRVLVGMRTGRLLSIYEPRADVTCAALAAVGGLGVSSSLLVLGSSLPTSVMAGVIATLGVLLFEAIRTPRSLMPRAR
ncbi:MAG: hypothetical protein GXP55_10365 [Deltaproteobacteria bacterium]|nr:hypothetical protein [Deltaproteobacteria bacterium]